MAVGVKVPEAMGWSLCEGGVRKPEGAAPLEDGCGERKLDWLAFGESASGVEDEHEAKGNGVVKLAGDERVDEDGMDSLKRERVK